MGPSTPVAPVDPGGPTGPTSLIDIVPTMVLCSGHTKNNEFGALYGTVNTNLPDAVPLLVTPVEYTLANPKVGTFLIING
jgi:hypothetical protein